MKLTLTLLLVLLISVGVLAQDRRLDVYIWAGGEFTDTVWHDTMYADPGEWIDIPIYLMGETEDVWVGDLSIPLGINLTYIDSFNVDACQFFYPFTEWGIAEFGGENPGENWDCPDPQPGWNSLSFGGNARFIDPYAPLGHWETPTLGFSFNVHVVDDSDLSGLTICEAIGEGCNMYCGGAPNVGDSVGGEGYNAIMYYACLRYSGPSATFGTVTGIVTDVHGAPIENVHITVDDGFWGEAWTGSDGTYTITDVRTSLRDFTFSHSDYVDMPYDNFYVSEGDNTLDMVMWLPAEDDAVFWVGNLDGSPITAIIGRRLYLDVYLQTSATTFGAELHVPLGTEDIYFDSLLSSTEGQYYYPLTEWETAGFEEPYGSPPNQAGWSSESFVGFTDLILPDPWLNFDIPTKILTFMVKVVDDSQLIGDTVACVGLGGHPDGWPWRIGDTLSSGYYSNVIHINEVTFVSVPDLYEYRPADVNMYFGIWPPHVFGSDMTYLVNYFRGVQGNWPCLFDGFWASADVNGDCLVIGSDVTRLLSYFRGTSFYTYCPDYEPAWMDYGEVPDIMPAGWPYCEDVELNSKINIIPTEIGE